MPLFTSYKINQPAGIEVRKSQLHGLGVFAGGRFKTGAVIETAPLILLEKADRELLQSTKLFSYYFLLDNRQTPAALGLGLSSLYNHSSHANALYKVSLKRQCLIISACRDIEAGDEITLNYNGQPDDESPVYFPTETE